MISTKAKSLAIDLQAALTSPEANGLGIHRGLLDLMDELGGSRLMADKLATPIAQTVYLLVLLIQRIDNVPAFKLQQKPDHTELREILSRPVGDEDK